MEINKKKENQDTVKNKKANKLKQYSISKIKTEMQHQKEALNKIIKKYTK